MANSDADNFALADPPEDSASDYIESGQCFIFTNATDDEMYTLFFENEGEARHWVINHLDLSKNWSIT